LIRQRKERKLIENPSVLVVGLTTTTKKKKNKNKKRKRQLGNTEKERIVKWNTVI